MITLDKVYSLILEASIYDMEKTPRKRRPRAKVDGTPIKGRFNADILKDINYADETSLNQFVKTLVSNEGRDRTSPYYPIRQLVHFFDLQGGAEKTMWGADAKWTLGMLRKLEPKLENCVFTLRKAHKDLIKLIYGKDASAPKGHQLAIDVCNKIKGCIEAADIVVNKINKHKDALADSKVWTGDKTGKQLGLGKILTAYIMKKDKLLAVIKKLETIAGNGYNPMSYTSTGKRIMGEAFKAGNQARKKEAAVDAVQGVGSEQAKIQQFVDFYKISLQAAIVFKDAYKIINACDFEPECATKWECLIMLAAMLADDDNPAKMVFDLGYKRYRQYGENNPYDFSWFEEPDDILDCYHNELRSNETLMRLFKKMVSICNFYDITPDTIYNYVNGDENGEGEQGFFCLHES